MEHLRLLLLLSSCSVLFSRLAGAQRSSGRGQERIKVLFTPTICKVRCTQGRCTNFCERGNVTTLYNSEQETQGASGPGFRVFLCPMLCQNGGVCIQKDRCLCPPNFTGKFCHIPVTASSTNDIEKPLAVPPNQLLTHSEYVLPLQSQPHAQPIAPGSSMVKVRVQHPPEASVKIHQVLKVGFGPTVREHSETVTWSSGLSGARTSMQPGERAEAPPPRVQAQTLRGDFTYTESSGFKYCFREVSNGQCRSPLPGLRNQETCCRGIGLAWGINECVLCPSNTGNGVAGRGNCPNGFERINGTQCVDTNECSQPGVCEHGTCVNTRGSYSCVCEEGYILDASHGICVSQKVISEEKDQCYRILNTGFGPGSCSLPILRNITKQICCCSRVGKAWGRSCERCPYFGSVEFKEICPAGPGYHYSASAFNFNQRVVEQQRMGAPLVIPQSPQTRPQQPASTGPQSPQTRPQQPASTGPQSPQTRPQQPASTGHQSPQTRPQQTSGTYPVNPATAQQERLLNPSTNSQTARPTAERRPVSPVRPGQPIPPPATPHPAVPRPAQGVCETKPTVCGAGRCVDQPGGRHTCVCNQGYQLNIQQTQCQDMDECRSSPPPCRPGQCLNSNGGYRCTCPVGYQIGPQGTSCTDVNECLQTPSPCSSGQCENTLGSYKCTCPSGYRSNSQQSQCQDIDECRQIPNPCSNGRCENSPGSFRCVCRVGYKLRGNTCTDIDECADPLQCPGQECVNSQGSYRCVSCKPGFGLLNGQCSDVDECRQTPVPCSNGRCENSPGSFRCVCLTGYKLQGNACSDVDECTDPAQCPGQVCVNSQGSYRCVSCRPGFELQNGQCSDVDECHQTPAPCVNGRCENSPGSFRCVCLTGYSLQGNTCTDVDECTDSTQCPGQECVNSQGSYRCVSCKTGFRLLNRQCSDVDECRQIPNICFNGRCENAVGGYECVCRTGFKLQDNTCTDVNECEKAAQCPGQECVNSEGSFKCLACKAGFELHDSQCQDVDECRQTPAPCSNGFCENSPGSFRCVCLIGYKLQGNTCLDVDECEDPFQCPGQQCVNTAGSYKCTPCRSGHAIQNGRCSDLDECQRQQHTCGSESVCENTDGSYRCNCRAGFRATGVSQQCRDVNECMEGEFCFPRGECVNTFGSYRCVCAEGYRADTNGSSCLDLDECARTGVCQDGHCVNTEGSFQCQCQAGFTSSPERTACLDVDECVDSEGAVCGLQRCENTIGSYRCFTTCEAGYSVTPTGECVDINECANDTVCGEHAFCQNLIGTYQCMCDQGYEATINGRGCVDENECEKMQGVCGAARCENVEGSFLCECPGEGAEFDPRTGLCLVPLARPEFTDSSSSSSSSVPGPHPRPFPDSGSLSLGQLRECYYNLAEQSACSVLAPNTTQQECCCTVGQAWGLGCRYDPCPAHGTAEHQTLCPSGRGYVTTGLGAFSYRDVDECKLFDPTVCKGGVCVNNIPGYSCYCSTGYYYDTVLLECTDNNECEGTESCPDGICVNTVGSYYCTCEPPLVLDDSQLSCVNSTSLTEDENLSFCWQYMTADLVCQSPLLGAQVTYTECCCLYGKAWGLQCALCPAGDSDDYEALCYVLRPPAFPPPFPDRYNPAPEAGPSRRGGYRPPPYSPPRRPEFPRPPDYDDYSLPEGARSGFRGRPSTSFGLPDPPFRRPDPGSYYDDEDYAPPEPAIRPPFRTPDPRLERAFGARPPPPVPEGRPLSLAPLPNSGPYGEDEEPPESWRFQPPFSSYPERPSGGDVPRRLYERRYEPYEGLRAEDCGILRGCENGRCIRVSEGYTCDCYDGYQLDMTSMTCIDTNECEEAESVCVNGQCANTEGSYRCVCARGFVPSRRPNYCVLA